MKTLPSFFYVAFLMFFAWTVLGQDSLALKSQVFESEEAMINGTQTALVVTLEVTDAKLADKVWKNFMKDYNGKTKGVKGGKEDLTTGAEMVGINGVNPLSIYSRSSSSTNGYVEMIVWFDLGDEYLSGKRRTQYEEAEKLLLKYALECKKEQTQNELDDAEKKLKSLENDQDKLKRLNNGYHKDIEEAERKIEQAKENIVKNEEQQVDTSQKISLQKELVEEIKRRLSNLRKN
jgi:hypothetical protein